VKTLIVVLCALLFASAANAHDLNRIPTRLIGTWCAIGENDSFDFHIYRRCKKNSLAEIVITRKEISEGLEVCRIARDGVGVNREGNFWEIFCRGTGVIWRAFIENKQLHMKEDYESIKRD
jgi:hypothetical protein